MVMIFVNGVKWASLVARMVKKSACNVGEDDPLEKGLATNSSILSWTTPWTEDPGELQSMGSQKFGHNWATSTFSFHGMKESQWCATADSY